MKLTALLVLFTIIISRKSLGQDSVWRTTSFNGVLSFSLPSNFQTGQSGYIKGFAGELNSNFYGFQYYDSIISPIKNESMFQTSLLGFMSGRASDSTLKGYSALVFDTLIGGIRGLMGKFTNEHSSRYRQIYYYVTMANNRYCWFYVYSPSTKENNEEINLFFESIQFNSEKLKEKEYRLAPVYLKKDNL